MTLHPTPRALTRPLSHQIQFPPVASLSAASDRCEFDLTLSKSDVTKMLQVCVSLNRGAKVRRQITKMDKTAVTLLVTRVDKRSKM